MKLEQERRRFERVLFETPAKLIDLEGEWPTKVLDLSLKGALVEIPANFNRSLGESFLLEIALNSDIIISMDCTIVYQREKFMGLQSNFVDLESITHLKRIISFNSNNSLDLLERDLSNLISND
ncbi:MAG: PilZ domain-containing protein [Succinivibrionaceae bacterium]|jgi:hypothetical protein|nr:PilZ domain-containing protein [Succinivibrionaceae bacterium]